jgi:hypothetical protein
MVTMEKHLVNKVNISQCFLGNLVILRVYKARSKAKGMSIQGKEKYWLNIILVKLKAYLY